MKRKPKVVVIMTSHNRWPLTSRAISSVNGSALASGITVEIVLNDDGSSDHTAENAAKTSNVHVIRGSGDDYWAKGMSNAENYALEFLAPDVIVWLNDDVELKLEAFEKLMYLADAYPESIIVGATKGATGTTSYSGFRRRKRHPMSFAKVEPSSDPQELDSFNGNLVWVPKVAFDSIGPIDGSFPHSLADIDYGTRARKRGIPMLLAPGHLGFCEPNPEPDLTVRASWHAFVSRKGGGNPRAMVRYLSKHTAPFGLIYVPITYLLWWLRQTRRGLR